MNTDHDDLTRQLGRELHGQVDGRHDAPLDLGSVKGRARGIQRRRRVAGAAVAAAFAVVAVPVGLSLADGTPPDSAPPVAPSPDSPAPTPQEDGSFRLTIDLPQAAPAAVPYVVIDQKLLVTPDGERAMPEAYPQIVEYGDGWVALSPGGSGPAYAQVVELDSDFEVLSSVPSGEALAVTDDGSRVAWVEYEDGESTLVSAPADGSEPVRTRVSDDVARPVGFLPDGKVVFTSTDRDTGQETFGVVTTSGEATGFDGFLHLYDASETSGLVGGMTAYNDDGTSCSGVVDPVNGDGDLLWERCDYSLGDFSPDGRYVVGLASQFDGPGSPTLSILDAMTGAPVVDFRSEPRSRTCCGVDQVVWEDDDSVLATVTEGPDQAMVRAGLDGTLQRVTERIPTHGLNVEYWFAHYAWM